LLVIFILCWVAVSPNRPVKELEAGADLSIVVFFYMLFVGLMVFFGKFPSRSPIPLPHLVNGKFAMAAYGVYGFAAVLTFCVFVCGANIHRRMEETGLGPNYYSHFIICNEDKYNPNNPYTFTSVCDHTVLPSVQALIFFSVFNLIMGITAQLLYFGHILPFYFQDYTDRKGNPVNISFMGVPVAGYPVTVTLARKDAENVIQNFYENFELKQSPVITIPTPSPFRWKNWF